jgi:hypothetical protein
MSPAGAAATKSIKNAMDVDAYNLAGLIPSWAKEKK